MNDVWVLYAFFALMVLNLTASFFYLVGFKELKASFLRFLTSLSVKSRG